MTIDATDWSTNSPRLKKRNPKWARRAALFAETPLPPYGGGTPVIINEMMRLAKINGDFEAQDDLRRLSKKLFRNRRSESEKMVYDAQARMKFIAKYGQAGQIALNKDDLRRRLSAMSPDELEEYLEELTVKQDGEK